MLLCSAKSVKSSEKDVREHRHHCEPDNEGPSPFPRNEGNKVSVCDKDMAQDSECDGSS